MIPSPWLRLSMTGCKHKPNTRLWRPSGRKYSLCKYIVNDQCANQVRFYFSDIRDIHDVVEITVYDEDKDHKFEFLGRVQIPLLKVKNGERKWFKLKDKTLRKKAKGEEAEILLEMNLMWNPLSLFYFFCQAPAQTPQSKKAKTFFMDKFFKIKSFLWNFTF